MLLIVIKWKALYNYTLRMSKNKLSNIFDYLHPKINIGTNLVYFASGTNIKKEYFTLPYDNIFLVDMAFKEVNNINSKIFTIPLESTSAVNLFKLLNIEINCMVSINEGLGEGGGIYHINSDVFLGYVMPVFTSMVIHIGSLDYYSYQDRNKYLHIKQHYLDIPFSNIETLSKEDKDYLNPNIFNTRYNGIVTKLYNKSDKNYSFVKEGVNISVIHKSIWEDVEDLDACFVIFDNQRQQKLFSNFHNNIYPIWVNHDKSQFPGAIHLNDIKDLIKDNNWDSIGLLPNGCHYSTLITRLLDSSISSLKDVNFYHLNINDFSTLYKE